MVTSFTCQLGVKMTDAQPHSFDATAISAMAQRYRANFINSLSGFKSACLLGTANEAGENVAIMSSVVHIGANPPLLGLIMRPHSVQRDSLAAIKQTKAFTLNHVHKDWTAKAHQTAARYPENVSEFDEVGLSPWYSPSLSAPFVKESPLKIGLQLAQHEILCNDTELIIGRVCEVHVDNSAIAEDGYVDIEALGSVCISGLDSYHQTSRLAQYAYAKPGEPTREK